MAVTKSTDPIDILLEMGIDLDNLSEEEDYLSALKEAIAKIQFQTKGAGDERQRILQEEVIKVRKSRKAADPKFKAKTTKVSSGAFFNKKEPTAQSQPVPGQKALPGRGPSAVVKRQTIKPELFKKPEKPEEQKDNKDLKENNILKDILNTLNSILGTLKKQNKLSAKQAEKDRKAKEKKKRGAQEEKLESPIKKFLGAANKIVKPVKSFLDGLLEFFVKVFIGRLLVKLINWGSENGDKVDAILGFFEKTWPALLAAGLLFFTGLGGFIGNLIRLVAGFIPRLLGLVPKILKGVVGLAKFAIANPAIALATAVAGTGLAAIAANQDGTAVIKDPENPDKSQADEIREYGGMTGAPISGDMLGFSKGGQVPGSGNSDTVRAMLTPGEFVMSKGAVQQYGLDTMKSMNAAGGGTNIPMVSDGITYAAGGGEIADPNEKLKPNDEPKDRPKGDHSHELGHILGLDKVSGMVSKFAKSPLGNIMMPGVGAGLSIAESLMGGPAQASETKSSTSTSTSTHVTATPKTPAVSSSTKTEQPKKKGGNMFGGLMDAMTFNMFDFDGMGKPSSMSASPEEGEDAPKEEGEKSGGGGSLKGLTGQDFRDLAYIVSGEAQRGTDDEYGVAAAVLNRVADPAWPNSIKEVGSQSGQFEAVYTGKAYDDPELAQKLASPEGQAKIVEALKMLKGRTDFKGTSQYGNMGQGDVKFSDRGNFYHYKEQVGKTDPPPSPIPTYYQKFIGSGGPAVTLSGTKSSASGITASPGSGGSGGGSSKTSGTSGPGGSTGRFQSSGGPGSVGSKTSYGDYLKNLYGKKKSADGITPLPSSTMSKGKSAGGPSADAGKNPGNQMTSPDNNIPAINAEAMHSDEKIEVLGIEIS